MIRKILAQSKNYKLFKECEDAQLEGLGIKDYVTVGDFYGDVTCACIDEQEKWCISGGNGLVIYTIAEPFLNYTYEQDNQKLQWKELGRNKQTWLWPETIYQVENDVVRIVIDVYSKYKGVYDLNIKTLELLKKA